MTGLRDRLRERYNQRYASEDFLTAGPLRGTFIRVIEEDLTAYAERVPLPTLLIWGDQDQDSPCGRAAASSRSCLMLGWSCSRARGISRTWNG